MSANTAWSVLSYAVSLGVSLTLEVAMLIVAIAVVRKHRRDAWGWFGAVAAVQVFGTATGMLGWSLGSALVARSSGVEGMIRYNAAMSLAHTLLSAVSGILLLIGIMQLARPVPVAPPGGPFANLDPS